MDRISATLLRSHRPNCDNDDPHVSKPEKGIIDAA
jgi:hypothetical protein